MHTGAGSQVLAFGAPSWALLDPANPVSGGVRQTFYGETPPESDPYCGFDPASGEPYGRVLRIEFQCAPAQEGAVLVRASVNTTSPCDVTLAFATSVACWAGPADPDDALDAAEAVAVVGSLLALAVGALIVMCVRRRRRKDDPETARLYVPGAPPLGGTATAAVATGGSVDTLPAPGTLVGWNGSEWVALESSE